MFLPVNEGECTVRIHLNELACEVAIPFQMELTIEESLFKFSLFHGAFGSILVHRVF